MKLHKRTRALTILFFVVSFFDIIGVAINNSLVQEIFKPMIILSLMLLYFLTVKNKNKWYLLALAFSFLGDVLLMDKNNLFLYGIASFLITQVIFIKLIYSQLPKVTLQQILFAISPFVIYITVLLSVIKNHLHDYFIPVIIYGITISIFGIISLLNYMVCETKEAQVLLIGAILFIISDSLIALHKFHVPKAIYPVVIMLTYVLAQYLIFTFFAGKIDNFFSSDSNNDKDKLV